MKTLFDIYLLDDSKWIHAIYESMDEYISCCGEDLDHNGSVDDHDYELYLNSRVEKLDNKEVSNV